MSTDGTSVLLASEAESYVEHLKVFPLAEIGSQRWAQQHEYIEKLNMQAVLSATANEDEYVKEFLISYGKYLPHMNEGYRVWIMKTSLCRLEILIPSIDNGYEQDGDHEIQVLIEDMITTEVWKHKVFPEFLEQDLEVKVTFPMYMVLYHEATVANLLETVMYHSASCEAAEDAILDLLDYCYRKITFLIAKTDAGELAQNGDEELGGITNSHESSSLDELERQDEKLNMDICIKAVSILRYLTDHIKCLPLSVIQRLLNTHDTPLLLVKLIENPPWTRRDGGKIKKYIDNKWQELPYEDQFRLTKIEGQVWIAMFHLLMEEECQNKYEFDEYRKNVILKLRSHLNEILLDQMPVLCEMQRYLEQLAIMEPPTSRRALILEQVPEMRDRILKAYEGKWLKIAKKQHKNYFNDSRANIQAQAQRLSEMYDFDMLETLIAEPPKCVVCGEQATKRCSRCQNEWYCRRECQVSHWKKHKQACDLLVDAVSELKAQEKGKSAT